MRAFRIEAFSPDGRTLSTGRRRRGRDRLGRAGGTRDRDLEGHRGAVWSQAFSPDGRTLYTAGDDSSVDHLGRGRRPPARTAVPHQPPRRDARELPAGSPLSPDGRTLAVARRDGRVDLIDAETLRRTGGFEAFAGRSALAIEYSPDGRRLAVAGAGGGVGLWDAGSGKRVGPLLRAPVGPERHNSHNVQALAFGPGGLLAAASVGGAPCGSGTSTGGSWSAGHCAWVRGCSGWPSAPTARSSRSRSAGRGRRSPTASRFAIPAAASGSPGCDSDRQVRSVAFSPDGRLLAGGQLDGRRSSGRPTAGVGWGSR